MGSFGEDLRMERMSRGIALEDITAVTKISQRHLLALEQDRMPDSSGLKPLRDMMREVIRFHLGGGELRAWRVLAMAVSRR